jgi:hypothetical protein
MQMGSLKRPLIKKEATPKNTNRLTQKSSDKKEATRKNVKGLTQKISDEKGGNPEKYKGAHSKGLR